ncbi:MAG: hypothetical protein ABEH40_09195 [Haloferacaceae archaeon]
MELRCLLGHEFGEREVERERREAGDEVVVIYRTVENCRRCGTRRVVSENKEVRSIDAEPADERMPAADEAGTDGAPAPADEADTDGERPVAAGTGDGNDAGSLAGDGAPDAGDGAARPGSLIEAAEAVGAVETGEEDEDEDDAAGGADDDAVIIGDGPDAGAADADREPAADGEPVADAEGTTDGAPAGGAELLGGPGGAGGADATGTADGGADAPARAAADADDPDDATGGWPDPAPDGEDEGYDASPHEDTATDVDFGGGFAPTVEEGAGPGAGGTGVEPAFVRAEAPSAATDSDGPTELRCPNCGATRTAAGSSLRGGDICPECRKGYVAERAAEE